MQRAPLDPFPSTAWSAIHASAAKLDVAEQDRLWRELVEAYRRPIEATIRRILQRDSVRACVQLDADDVTDEFFAHVFEHDVLCRADPQRGRFRAFIQGVARNYVFALARRWSSRAGQEVDDIEDAAAPPDAALQAEEEIAWAITLFEDAVARLEARHPEQARVLCEYHGIGRDGSAEPVRARDLADRLGVTPNAISLRRHRAGRFVRMHIRNRIADSVAGHVEFDDEVDVIERRIEQMYPGLLGATTPPDSESDS